MGEQAEGIVEYWRAVELLSPPTVPAHAPAKDVYDIRPSEPLPWELGHPSRERRLRRGCAWRYTVYCGVHRLDDAYGALARLLPPEPTSFDRRRLGDGALAAFVVNGDGRPVFGSEVLSSAAWAVPHIVRRGAVDANWLRDFPAATAAFERAFETTLAPALDDEMVERLREDGVDVGRYLDLVLLTECLRMTAAQVGSDELFPATGVRVECRQVAEHYVNDTQHDFLNSFIAEDLAHVARALRRGDAGAALLAYLADEVDECRRADVDAEPELVRAKVNPTRTPAGRWPSPPEHALALSQQFAANASLETLTPAGGMFAVNGPPGTGKTTMLREVIAANVVARADVLAALNAPSDAFTGQQTWQAGDYRRTTHLLAPQLTGFEIVVACATNAAAENITMELPANTAIDSCWGDTADYFSEIATEALRGRSQQSHGETATPAWGLVAACLGNAANRQAFRSAFWFGRRQRDGELAPTMRSFLNAASSDAGRWSDAVAAYSAARRTQHMIAEQRAAVAQRLEDLPRARARAAACSAQAEAARRRHTESVSELDQRRAHDEAHEQLVRRRAADREDHARMRPGFVQSLFTLGAAMRQWRARDEELADAFVSAIAERDEYERVSERLRVRAAEAAQAVLACSRARDAAAQTQTQLEAQLAVDRASWGTDYPDQTWWDDRRRRELRAPWLDEEWNRARTTQFIAALQLHEAFLAAAADEMRDNLRGMVDLLGGAAPQELPEPVARALWQSLFLVVPVVSTTFASFPRLFSHLARESLGWVIVNEAGQAQPQKAIGALWRSRRALIVGDPLQLPPIVSLPFTVQQALRQATDVDELWLPSWTSVQQLADRVSPVGAWRGDDDAPLWVGSPLNVHRRCDEPMFSVANKIAYQDRMVNGTPPRPDLAARPSEWIDVASNDADGHWIPAEGQQLLLLLKQLGDDDVDPSRIFAIAPFRDVARRLHMIARRFAGLRAGTIHTMQGREADVVILVLGGNPSSPGAKRWAAETPNVLNVAVTRACRRLYVIGDRRTWADHPYFDTLAAALPARSPDDAAVVRVE